jgi:hypothetical protein
VGIERIDRFLPGNLTTVNAILHVAVENVKA